MNFLSRDNLSRILSGGVGMGSRFKASKRLPSPKSSPQGRGLFCFKGIKQERNMDILKEKA